MITKGLVVRMFDAAYMQRWNDRLRPVELFEIDKQAHKMIAAYCIGKFSEHEKDFDWISIIEGGIFELLQRVVLTDIKPPVFYRIKSDRDKYRRLNEWIYGELKKFIAPLGGGFAERFRAYFETEDESSINRRVLGAAHIFATRWEFSIIEGFNLGGFDIENIRKSLDEKMEEYADLPGMQAITAHNMHNQYKNFLDLCGQLRFQYRWSNLHKTPKTSVLGHMLMVAILSYLYSLELNACPRRAFNNYFTGLFHDLPEVLTRDIISPVKRSVEGLKELIKEYEKELMDREVFSLLPTSWHPEMRMFTEEEFSNIAELDGEITELSSEEISAIANSDGCNPRDGSLVKASDELSAFIEAWSAIKNGSTADDFHRVKVILRDKYDQKTIAGINFGQMFADFE